MLEIPNSLVSKLEQFQTEYPEIVYKFYLRKRFEAPDGKVYSFGKEITGEENVRNSK